MPPAGQLDVTNLSNKSLTHLLESLGVDVGPITVATRRTYERHLIKLQTGVLPPSGCQSQPMKDDDDDDDVEEDCDEDSDEDDETTSSSYTETKQRAVPFLSELSWPHMRSRGDTDLSSDKRNQYSLPSERHSGFSRSTRKQRSEEDSKAIPLWLKLLALSISLTLIYLIYVNIEMPAVST